VSLTQSVGNRILNSSSVSFLSISSPRIQKVLNDWIRLGFAVIVDFVDIEIVRVVRVHISALMTQEFRLLLPFHCIQSNHTSLFAHVMLPSLQLVPYV